MYDTVQSCHDCALFLISLIFIFVVCTYVQCSAVHALY